MLEINLDNLVLNMNYYRSKIKNDTKLMVMVKAFAYGSGNFEISNVLEFHHADYLTVAFADEGVELRNKGIALPIMVMSPEKNAFENIIRYDLEPEIYSLRSLFMLESAMEQMKLPADKIIKIHVKLDTGMHRLGFLPDDIEELIVRLKSNPHLKVQSIFLILQVVTILNYMILPCSRSECSKKAAARLSRLFHIRYCGMFLIPQA